MMPPEEFEALQLPKAAFSRYLTELLGEEVEPFEEAAEFEEAARGELIEAAPQQRENEAVEGLKPPATEDRFSKLVEAHMLVGRVVLAEPGGIGVEGAVAEAIAKSFEAEEHIFQARTGRDGSFVIVFQLPWIDTLRVRVSLASGVRIEERQLESPGDHQCSFTDLAPFVVPPRFGGLDIVRRPPSAPPRPRVGGRVVDSGGECSIHCLQVLIEATVAPDTTFRPIAVARTDRSGRFFVDYPNVKLTAVRAVIPGVDQPLALPTTDQGLIAPEPLLVIDLKAAEKDHESSGCDCGSTEVPRLPGQAELADASATYSADLGAGCITFNTPNRAIEEFDFWTVVRTSQPTVRRTSGVGAGGSTATRQELGERLVEWDASPDLYQAANVAHGHLLHFRQTWYADGYSLGDLLYSLPLAPGQKKLISVVEWERSESAARQETTLFTEAVSGSLQRDRDITEVISAALSEQSRGGSTSSTWGIGAGTGGAGNGSYQGFNFGALFGISGGFSRADSEAWQNSSRNFASTSMNSLRDRVLQSASAVRGIRSTVVTTVGQSEAVRAETDVVANHNRCHALTIQYFEVLRHFQMRHELVEVKECMFVPLPIGPFDAQKALRWRDQIAPFLLRPDLAGAIEALRRVESKWIDTPTPAGRYADESVVEILGEFEIEFQAYPPPLPDPDKQDPVATAVEQSAGAIIASIFFPPAAVILPAAIATSAAAAVSSLKATRTEELRFQKFHRDYMPRFAARFINELSLVVRHPSGSKTVPADFTLVSRYQPDRPLLVSFRADITGLTRAQILALSVEATKGIPDAVRCLVRALRSDYATPTFGHPLVAAARLNGDLDGPRLVVDTGTFPFIKFKLDPSTADPVRIRTPLDSWERRSPRDEDRRLAARLLDHLNANLEYYHHAIWWTMDPNRRYLLLDGFLAPNGGGRSIAQVVENKLIGIVGNSLVMPVAPGNRLDPLIRLAEPKPEGTPTDPGTGTGTGTGTDDAEVTDPTGLLAYYMPPTPVPPARVSLPTKGVFAEAVMGACNACERIDDSRFWRWEQSPLDEPPAIQPSSTESRRTEPEPTTPTTYPTPIVSIQNAPAAPEPTDLTKVFELLGREVFRDLTGLAGTQANAAATYKQNLETALAFGKEASELAKQAGMLGAKDRAFASIDSAEQDGKISKEEAHDLRLSALKKIVGDAGDVDADVAAAKKRLGVVGDADKSGVVDQTKAKELSGTILENLATGNRPRTPERDAAARKIAEMPSEEVSNVEVQHGDSTTRVESGPGDGPRSPGGVTLASTGTDWIFWADLITHRVPTSVVADLRKRSLEVVRLLEAWGDVNLDFYPVRISKLPSLGGKKVTPEELLKHVRTHFDDFVDPDNSSFPPLDNAIDKPVWESDNPLGAVIDIQVNVGDLLGLPPVDIGKVLGLPPFSPVIDRALVVCSLSEPRRWIFSTLRGPLSGAAGHPVTGNRMWAIDSAGQDWMLYTMGADRATTAGESLLSGLIWSGADSLWLSFQQKVAEFVNSHEGKATIPRRHSDRYSWRAIEHTLGLRPVLRT